MRKRKTSSTVSMRKGTSSSRVSQHSPSSSSQWETKASRTICLRTARRINKFLHRRVAASKIPRSRTRSTTGSARASAQRPKQKWKINKWPPSNRQLRQSPSSQWTHRWMKPCSERAYWTRHRSPSLSNRISKRPSKIIQSDNIL